MNNKRIIIGVTIGIIAAILWSVVFINVLNSMAGMALRENDIGYARFLLGKVQAVAHILEMGKYNGIRQCLILYVQGKM